MRKTQYIALTFKCGSSTGTGHGCFRLTSLRGCCKCGKRTAAATCVDKCKRRLALATALSVSHFRKHFERSILSSVVCLLPVCLIRVCRGRPWNSNLGLCSQLQTARRCPKMSEAKSCGAC